MAEQPDDIVAVVDDDSGVLDAMKFWLETGGHRVAAYASAAEFLLDRISRHACLIVDHYMPHMTGLELALHLRRENSSLPIVLMTGAPSAAIVSGAAQAGIAAVLAKPVDPDALLTFIKTAIESRR
jgi:FixJ family two-component response regulator